MTVTKPLIYATVEAVLGLAGLALIWITLGWLVAVAIFLCMFSTSVKILALIELHIQEQHK
jgi:hypothetical protein